MEHAVKRDTVEEPGDDLSYKPRPPLAKPGYYLRDIRYLIKAMDNNKIDINPEYQREVVWTADRMSQLIDSLMENYYIPPLIFNETRPPGTSDVIHVCIDGKQRLSSVKAFVQGLIPCHDHRGDKWWFCNTNYHHKNVLSEREQKDFLDKDFMAFEYTGLRPEDEEHLFARVQMGMPLSVAEKMRSQTGPWQELARCFVNDFPRVYNLQKDRTRAKDFQLTLSCFSQIMEVQRPTMSEPILRTTHTHIPKLLKNTDALDDDTKSHLASVWTAFQDLIELDPDTFTNANKRLKGVQTFAPVEMVAITVLISCSMYSENRNNRVLIQDIQALRESLRRQYIDLRSNAPTWKTIWTFIRSLNMQGAVDGGKANANARSGTKPTSKAVQKPAVSSPGRGRPPKIREPPSTMIPERGTHADPPAVTAKTKSGAQEPRPDTSESRPRKRQRTGSIDRGNTTPRSKANSPDVQVNDMPSLGPSFQEMPFRTYQPLQAENRSPDIEPRPIVAAFRTSSSVPTGNSIPAPGPASAPAPQRAPRQPPAPPMAAASLTTQKPQKETPTGDHVKFSLPKPSSVSGTKPVIPSEARQNRRTELDSYRTPVAAMSTGRVSAPPLSSQATPYTPIYTPVSIPKWGITSNGNRVIPPSSNACPLPPLSTFTVTPLVTTQTQAPLNQALQRPSGQSATRSIRTPILPCGPIQAEQLVPRSAAEIGAPTVTAPAPTNKGPGVPNKKKRSSIPQYDGATIDLTMDEPEMIEAQRVDLLFSFQKKSSIAEAQNANLVSSIQANSMTQEF